MRSGCAACVEVETWTEPTDASEGRGNHPLRSPYVAPRRLEEMTSNTESSQRE